MEDQYSQTVGEFERAIHSEDYKKAMSMLDENPQLIREISLIEITCLYPSLEKEARERYLLYINRAIKNLYLSIKGSEAQAQSREEIQEYLTPEATEESLKKLRKTISIPNSPNLENRTQE